MKNLGPEMHENSVKRERCQCKCEVFSRIVGFMRPVSIWNPGKQEEFKNRKTFHLKRLPFECIMKKGKENEKTKIN